MKSATLILHNLHKIVEDLPVVEKIIEKVIEIIPVIEKDITTVEQIFADVSIESDTVQEPEPVSSSSSDKLALESIYPDYDDEILDDIPDELPVFLSKKPSFRK